MLLTGARILTMRGPDIESGFLRIQNGKIESLGSMSEAPPAMIGEEVVELSGKIITPGFIDAHSHMGMVEDGVGFEGEDLNEDSDPVTPHIRALDAINPFDRCFSEARAGGITCAVVSPGSTNPIAGQICAVKTVGRWVDKMVVREPLAMKLAFGENPKMTYNDKAEAPASRMATAAIIREQLAKARRYLADRTKAEKDGEDAPELDMKCEALIPLLEGKMKAHIHAHRAYDILTAVRIAGEFSLDYVVVHCTEGHLIADILAELGVTVICGPILCSRSKPELSNLSLSNCAALSSAGVKVAICTDHPEVPVNFLQLSASVAAAEGMDKRAALEALTITAAKAAGLDSRVGALAPGMDADILVFAACPPDAHAKPEMVFIDGERIMD